MAAAARRAWAGGAADDASDDGEIERYTDHYFNRTKRVIGKFGDCRVTYADLHAPPGGVRAAAGAANGSRRRGRERNTAVDIDLRYNEGKWVGAGEPMMYITGSFFHLVDLETIFLQKLGPACVAAYNAWTMCADMPKVAFLAMDARHCAGAGDGRDDGLCRLGRLGARQAQGRRASASSATPPHATAHFFGRDQGLGTMPHALIGYAGSTLRAAEMFHETFPGEPMTVLVDYFGREISDSLEVCRRFPDLAAAGHAVVPARHAPAAATSRGSIRRRPTRCWSATRPNRSAAIAARTELRYLVGTGVSAAAIFHLREALDAAGFAKAKIVASSGFGPAKCRVMAEAKAPIDVVGTGSLPAVELDRDLRHRRHRRV